MGKGLILAVGDENGVVAEAGLSLLIKCDFSFKGTGKDDFADGWVVEDKAADEFSRAIFFRDTFQGIDEFSSILFIGSVVAGVASREDTRGAVEGVDA